MTAGLKTLLLLIIRRDRIKLPLSIILFVASLLVMVPMLQNIYGDAASQQALQASFGTNPAGLFMIGPIDEASFGALFTIETLLWWGMVLAFINTTLVVRHTRHNEEIGAQELILSGQTHRATGLAAVLITAVVLNGLIAVGVGAGMPLLEGATWSTQQSWLYALVLGGFGLVWACIAAVLVQLFESGRAASGALAALIGASYIMRGIGDFMGKVDASGIHQPAWISWISPFGWMQAARPLTDPAWWPLIIPIGASVIMAVVGFVLLERRDVGAGLLPSRKGNLRASSVLASPLGLTLHLQKGIFIGWFLAVLAMVGTIGSLVPQMGDIFETSDAMRHTIEAIGGTGALIPSFMSAMMAITCLMVFAYVIHGLGRLRSEESNGYLENILATKLSRLRWAGLHLLVVLIGGLLMLATTGGGLAILSNAISEHSLDVTKYTLAGLSYAPVMLVFMALYLFLFGLVPRLAGGVSWLYFGFVTFALWLGPVVQLDKRIMDLSVLGHVAMPPAEDILITPLVVITVVSLAAMAIGLVRFSQRDLVGK